MNEVPGWWAFASRVPRAALWSMAQAAGGWSALSRCGRADLVELGVPIEGATRWLEHPDERSLGVPLTLADARYPTWLAEDERAPPVLYVQGDLSMLAEQPGVAIVGTRECTGRGSALARSLARALADEGVPVVSGLARGIDAAAHWGAIREGDARTVAVLGHGLAHQSPRSNLRLRDCIIARGGSVVSGWPDAVGPERWTFPARNRWIAGLSRAVVVVEGGVRSGALITARDALELGRDVWAVPGPVGEPTSEGPAHLLREQECADREGYALLRLRLEQLLDGEGGVVRSAARAAVRGPVPARSRIFLGADDFLDTLGLRARERPADAWLSMLLAGASVDRAARVTGRDPLELHSELTRRELDGELVRLPGGRYALAP